MTHSLEELKSGQLKGVKRLKLACGLNEFPEEVLLLKETLEVLDLSNNQLAALPDSIVELKHLRILFISFNNFTVFPSVLSKCENLNMIGFKANQIEIVPENAFPEKLRWLILTDNKIRKLPKSIGGVRLLQKCALAGNLIEELPAEMSRCKNLELLRISANSLKGIPQWLFKLPKLSWVAFGGNPASYQNAYTSDLASFNWNDFTIKELLGEGASGLIYKADWHSKKEQVAIKVFKGAVTSDGLPEDEMEASILSGANKSLIPILGKVKDHPEGKNGLIMKLISSDYINLGNPPSLDTCTRDTFDENAGFNYNDLLKIAISVASVCSQLHKKGINHGDLYAHNILINKNIDCLLGDFGAASFYDVNSTLSSSIERVEVRAFGCLLEDILLLIPEGNNMNSNHIKWQELIADCTSSTVVSRPSFSEVLDRLTYAI